MKDSRPSQTAFMVTCWRALAHHGLTNTRGFSDPFAEQLLSLPWRGVFRWLLRMLLNAPAQKQQPLLQHIDILPLRTLVIDAELTSAISRKIQQVVILGAGLDARAYRMSQLAKVHIFEVDHAATQRYKKRKTLTWNSACQTLTFVEVNFQSDMLHQRLAQAGHRTDAPTFWIWEGVTMYLDDAALRATLRAMADLSAPGSQLVVEYQDADIAPQRPKAMNALLRFWSEPMIGARTQSVMKQELETIGMQVVSDTSGEDWAQRFANSSVSSFLRRGRLIFART